MTIHEQIFDNTMKSRLTLRTPLCAQYAIKLMWLGKCEYNENSDSECAPRTDLFEISIHNVLGISGFWWLLDSYTN